MSNAIRAFGTLLQCDFGSGYTTIAEVTDLSGPALKLDDTEVTSHDSPDGWKEFIGGLLEAGEISVSINYVPTDSTHDASTGLISLMINRSVGAFQIVFPDGASTTWTFNALVTAFEPSEPTDDKLSADVTLKISGKPTLA